MEALLCFVYGAREKGEGLTKEEVKHETDATTPKKTTVGMGIHFATTSAGSYSYPSYVSWASANA